MSQIKPRQTALIILDMLNPLDFPEGKQIKPMAVKAAKKIQALKKRMRDHGVPVIYVNDNFGKWQSDWQKLYAAVVDEQSLGKELGELLKPDEEDYFVLKPRHSGFHQTPLKILLDDLKVKTLVLTGIAGNICVLFTANDAHMHQYEVIVPRDCTASNKASDNEFVMNQLRTSLKIATPQMSSLKWS